MVKKANNVVVDIKTCSSNHRCDDDDADDR